MSSSATETFNFFLQSLSSEISFCSTADPDIFEHTSGLSSMQAGAAPDNANPVIHATTARRTTKRSNSLDLFDEDAFEQSYQRYTTSAGDGNEWMMEGVEPMEEIDNEEIFDLIRSISDPEHPLTLEQLAVVSASQITVTNGSKPNVSVEFTPTIPHCSMATLIGLSLRVRLLRSLPERFKVDIKVKKGTHQSENAVNKQLNDKERVAAALENNHLVQVVQQCLSTADQRGQST